MTGLNYRDAGVDIDAGNELVERIKPAVKRTSRPGVLGSIGGFGGLFALPPGQYREPVLVSGTDGVGTKLRLALDYQRFDGIGTDLVAMCVNDIIVTGAEPLFFLDYYATGKLDIDVAQRVIEGIAAGCELSGCALIGGETAEMPGMYAGDDFDLAGFSVGAVERDAIIDGTAVKPGHVLIGLASSGPHSNGYSLIRKTLKVSGVDTASDCGGKPLIDALMEPTRIYVKSLLELQSAVSIAAMAHITGGGLLENLPRVLPNDCHAVVDTASWEQPAVFDWLRDAGNIEQNEMYRTFNCGIGMVVCVAEDVADQALTVLKQQGEQAAIIGRIETGHHEQGVVLQ